MILGVSVDPFFRLLSPIIKFDFFNFIVVSFFFNFYIFVILVPICRYSFFIINIFFLVSIPGDAA